MYSFRETKLTKTVESCGQYTCKYGVRDNEFTKIVERGYT